MAEVPRAFLRGECGEDGCDGAVQGVGAAGGGTSDGRLEFGKYPLDGVEVWGIGGEETQFCTTSLDGCASLGVLVDAVVVADHNIARAQGWREHLFDPGSESISVHRPFYQHWGLDPVAAQARDECVVAPVAMRDRADTGRATGCPPEAAGHLCVKTTFVNKDKLFGVQRRHPFAPLGTGLGDVIARLLGSNHSLFFYA